MFGIANQMLAAIALCVGTVLLINMKRKQYIWVTLVPMAFVTLTTTTAAVEMITHHYWPASASSLTVGINVAMIFLILLCTYTIFLNALIAGVRGMDRLPKNMNLTDFQT
jgi:carbon starvation protein